MEQRRFFIPEYFYIGVLEHGVGNGCLLEPVSSWEVAAGAVGVGAAGKVKGETGRIFGKEKLFPPVCQPVSPQSVLIVGSDTAFFFQPCDQFFPIAGTQVQMWQHTGAALPGNGSQLHEPVCAG